LSTREYFVTYKKENIMAAKHPLEEAMEFLPSFAVREIGKRKADIITEFDRVGFVVFEADTDAGHMKVTISNPLRKV
jgi:hypothetical protein